MFDPREICFYDDRIYPSIISFIEGFKNKFKTINAKSNLEIDPLPAYLDPVILSKRSAWLICAIGGIGTGSIEDDIKDAASLEDFKKEINYLKNYDHLLSYWMLAHYIAGNKKELDETLKFAVDNNDPWIKSIYALIIKAKQENSISLGALNDQYISEFQSIN